MISKSDRERDKAICEAATGGVWSWELEHDGGWTLYSNRGAPIDSDAPSGIGNMQHGYNMLRVEKDGFDWSGESLRALILAAGSRMGQYIADAEEMDRRISEVEELLTMSRRVRGHGGMEQYSEGMAKALRILRGEQ